MERIEATIEKVMASNNAIILDSFMKAQSVLSTHKRAVVSVSGGRL